MQRFFESSSHQINVVVVKYLLTNQNDRRGVILFPVFFARGTEVLVVLDNPFRIQALPSCRDSENLELSSH